MNGVGLRLRKIRESLRLQQNEFAPKLGLSRTALGKCERDQSFPNKKVLHILATQYNISMDYLLCNRGNVYYANDVKSMNSQKFPLDKEMEEMLSLMTHSPMVYHAVLGFLLGFKTENQEIIEKQLAKQTEIKK